MSRGATVDAVVLDSHHCRSPIIQGGLEIPISVSVLMENTERNRLAIKKYELLTKELYRKPVDGKFDDITRAVLAEIESDDESDQSKSDRLSEDDQVMMAKEAATSANESTD